MILMTDEKIIMEGDYKQIILTTHRIRQENKVWGNINITSIMLEQVNSCEYKKKSKPIYLIVGILFLISGYMYRENGAPDIASGFGLFGLLLFLIYPFTRKRGLFISSASAKIVVNTKGFKDENIKSFIDKLEIAKNDRLGVAKSL